MTRTFRRTLALGAAAIALTVGACDDPTVVDDHIDVDGFALYEGTEEIYRFMLDDQQIPTLTLEQGVHDVAFFPLDHDGNFIVEEDEHEEDEPLRITIADTSILTWTPEDPTGDDAHEFIELHGELNALQPGSTSMDVCVLHEGHCDFQVAVPVTVPAQ